MRMASWLELVLNIIGYGGFVVVASLHRPLISNDQNRIGDDAGQTMR
jgi:hypothetical protein